MSDVRKSFSDKSQWCTNVSKHTHLRYAHAQKIDYYKLNLSLSTSAASSLFVLSSLVSLFCSVGSTIVCYRAPAHKVKWNEGKKDNTQIRVNCNKIPLALSLRRQKKTPLTFIIAMSEHRKIDIKNAYIFVRSAQRWMTMKRERKNKSGREVNSLVKSKSNEHKNVKCAKMVKISFSVA